MKSIDRVGILVTEEQSISAAQFSMLLYDMKIAYTLFYQNQFAFSKYFKEADLEQRLMSFEGSSDDSDTEGRMHALFRSIGNSGQQLEDLIGEAVESGELKDHLQVTSFRKSLGEHDIFVDRFTHESPTEIWFIGLATALVAALILGGGELDLELLIVGKIRVKLHSITEFIDKLHRVLNGPSSEQHKTKGEESVSSTHESSAKETYPESLNVAKRSRSKGKYRDIEGSS
ncbi:MAG TPA: hypothetical protein VN285_06460 [Candidatus Deferrimicrobium sp.]|nr:hypothetical protein [Candidatus Deferrimicrobium sp.]